MRFTILFFLLLGFRPSFAQTLTLQTAKDEAAKDSPDLLRSKSVVKEAGWKKVETYNGFLPSVTAQANYLTSKKYVFTNVKIGDSPTAVAIPGIVPTSILTLQASLPLFDGFASTNRLRGARIAERAAENDYEWAKFQTERQVSLYFYRAIASKTIKSVFTENLRTLQDHLKEAKLFQRAGTSTNYDILRVEVQVSEAESELLDATDNVDIAKGQLAELLGHETDERDLDGELPVLDPGLVAGQDLANMNGRLDLAALDYKTQGLGFQEAAASRYFVPRLSLFSQYQYYNNLSDDLTTAQDYRNAYQVGLNLTWNIFDGMSSIAKSKQSVEQHYQAEKTLRKERLKASTQINIWKRKFLHNCSLYQARLDDVRKSKETVRLARSGQKVGARTNTDVLDAVYELLRAQAGVVNAQLGAIEALINLELVTGQKLYTFH
jgi:outer membrane protein TolC